MFNSTFNSTQPKRSSFVFKALGGLILVFLLSLKIAYGQLLTWNTFGNAGTEATEPSVSNNPNLTSSNLNYTGSTVTPAVNGNRFGGNNWLNVSNPTTQADAIAGNKYIQFTVTPNGGFSFTVTNLSYQWQSSGTGPTSLIFRSSADAFASNIGTQAVTGGPTLYTTALSGLSNITAATTIRVYGVGATGAGGTGGFDVTTNVVNVTLNGSTAAAGGPSLVWTPTSNTTFVATFPSAGTQQNGSISGTALTPGNITITAPSPFEVFNGSAWVSSYTIANGATLSATNVPVRIAAGTAGGPVGPVNITAAGGGASTVNFAVSGTVTGPATVVSVTSIPQKFYANHTFPSGGRTFNVSGTNLTDDIVVGPLAGYQFSTSSTFTTVSNSLAFTPSSGTVPTSAVYVRLTGASVGTFSGNIPVSATGAGVKNVAVVGQTYAAASNFAAGNYVVTSIGEAGTALSNNASPVFLREYTPAGTLVQTVLAPVSLQGANSPLTQSGTSTSEGFMNLSPDGKFLTFTGYSSEPFQGVSITGTASAVNPRVIARVNYQGVFNTTTTISDGYSANNIRSAVTIDGNNFWSAGAGGTGATGGGVRYSALGATTSTQVSTGNNGNTRVVNISNSQLYVSSGSAPTGVSSVGTGLPTTTGQGNTLRTSAGADPAAFKFLDLDPIAPGNDVMYVGSITTAAGIQKFSSTDGGTTWTARGTFDAAVLYRDMSLEIVSGQVVITAITGPSGNNQSIVRFTDVAAWNANISVPVAPTTIVPAVGTDVFLKGISLAPENVLTPEIDLVQTSVPAASIAQGTVNNLLYGIQLSTTIAPGILTSLSFTTSGAYVPADLVNFKLRFSTDATLSAGDATVATVTAIPTTGGTLTFTGLSQAIPAGTRYLFITADVSGCSSVGNTVTLTGNASNVNFVSAIKTGTIAAGNAQTISLGALENPTGVSAVAGAPTMTVSWTNPTCSDEIIIFMNTGSISNAVPPTTLPAFNTSYNIAPTVTGFGRLVYRGTVSPQTITALTTGTTYNVRVYNRKGLIYSSGVSFTYLSEVQGLFSRGSGNHTDAIWALTANGTAVTAASLGGFNSDRNIIIQNGHTVNLDASGVTVRDIIVNPGGVLRRSQPDYLVAGNPSNMAYFNLFGNINNNGTIGNGTLFNPLGFNLNGSGQIIIGSGVTNIGRMRKNSATFATSTLTISTTQPTNVRFPGAAIYVNSADSRLEVIIPTGRTLNITDPIGDIAFDGTDGTSGDRRGGSITVNGTLNVEGTVICKNNNDGVGTLANQTVNFTVGASGTATVNNFIADLTLGQTSTVTLNNRLNIKNVLEPVSGAFNANGQLQLVSSATNTGRIGQVLGGASVTGNVNLQRYVPNKGWHFIGHASTSGQVLANWNDNFNTYGPMPGTKFFNPGAKTSSIFAFDDFAPSTLSPEINGWNVPLTTNLNFQRGYRVNFGAAPVTFDNSGPIANGTVTTNLSYTGASAYAGWNLISNPHPAPINWDAVVLTNTNPALITFNPASNKYQVYLTSGAYGPAGYPTANTVVNAAGNIVASSQGIFVRANGPGASVAFPQSAKANSAGTFYRSSTVVENTLRIKLSDSKTTDEAVVRFMDVASPAYELGFDADKMSNPDFTLYTASMPDQKLAINSLGSLKGTEIVPVVIQSNQSGKFTLSFDELASFTSGTSVYLKDNLLKTLTEVNEATSYAFELKANQANSTSRFELIFAQQAGLSFNQDMFNSQIKLYPNPADAQSGVKLLLNGFANEKVTIEVSDLQGRGISTLDYNPTLSIETLTLSGIDKLSTGTYMVRTLTNHGAKVEKLVIK